MALDPRAADPGPSDSRVVEWGRLTWPEARAAVAAMPVALLPIGAVEQHGPHMTLSSDSLAAGALGRLIAERTGVVLLPTLPYGQVWSLSSFPGSLSISNHTLQRVLVDLVSALGRQRFKAVVLLSGHLGNMTAMKEAARDVFTAGGPKTYYLFYPGLSEAAAGVTESRRSHGTIVHADEMETSLLLALAPEAVHMERAVAEYPDYPPDFDVTPYLWDAVCSSGVFGDATAASAEKGRRLVDAVLKRTVPLIERLIAEVKQS